MALKTYFFDTYAFFEIIEGNSSYTPYTREIAIITTRMNLMELHYGLLKKFGIEAANRYYDLFLPFVVEIQDADIKEANLFRIQHASTGVSYIDCIGYTIASLRRVPFLTGDSQFKKLKNVEFVL